MRKRTSRFANKSNKNSKNKKKTYLLKRNSVNKLR